MPKKKVIVDPKKVKKFEKALTPSRIKNRNKNFESIEQRNFQPKCLYFRMGRCENENCTYNHDVKSTDMFRWKEPCKYYANKDCQKGDMCCYMHEKWPCKYFHSAVKGVSCLHKVAENCRFSHKPMDAEMKTAFEKWLIKEKSRGQTNKNEVTYSEVKENIAIPTLSENVLAPSLNDNAQLASDREAAVKTVDLNALESINLFKSQCDNSVTQDTESSTLFGHLTWLSSTNDKPREQASNNVEQQKTQESLFDKIPQYIPDTSDSDDETIYSSFNYNVTPESDRSVLEEANSEDQRDISKNIPKYGPGFESLHDENSNVLKISSIVDSDNITSNLHKETHISQEFNAEKSLYEHATSKNIPKYVLPGFESSNDEDVETESHLYKKYEIENTHNSLNTSQCESLVKGIEHSSPDLVNMPCIESLDDKGTSIFNDDETSSLKSTLEISPTFKDNFNLEKSSKEYQNNILACFGSSDEETSSDESKVPQFAVAHKYDGNGNNHLQSVIHNDNATIEEAENSSITESLDSVNYDDFPFDAVNIDDYDDESSIDEPPTKEVKLDCFSEEFPFDAVNIDDCDIEDYEEPIVSVGLKSPHINEPSVNPGRNIFKNPFIEGAQPPPLNNQLEPKHDTCHLSLDEETLGNYKRPPLLEYDSFRSYLDMDIDCFKIPHKFNDPRIRSHPNALKRKLSNWLDF